MVSRDCLASVLGFEFAFAEPLPQSHMECLSRIKQRFHAVGLERYHPPVNVRTEVSYHLIEPSQRSAARKANTVLGFFLVYSALMSSLT